MDMRIPTFLQQQIEEKAREEAVVTEVQENEHFVLLKNYLRNLGNSDSRYYFLDKKDFCVFNIKFADSLEKNQLGNQLAKAAKRAGYEQYDIFDVTDNEQYHNYSVQFGPDSVPLKWKIIRDVISEFADYTYNDYKNHCVEKEALQKKAEEDGITKDDLISYLELVGNEDGFRYYQGSSVENGKKKTIRGFYIEFANATEKRILKDKIDDVLSKNGALTYDKVVRSSNDGKYKNFTIWINDYDAIDKLFIVKKIVEELAKTSYTQYEALKQEADDGW